MSAFKITDLDLVCTKLGYDWDSMKSVQSLLIGEQPTLDELVHLAQQRGEAFLADYRSGRSNWTTIQQREETVFNAAVEDCLIRPPAGGWELLSEGPFNRQSDLRKRPKPEKGVKEDGSMR